PETGGGLRAAVSFGSASESASISCGFGCRSNTLAAIAGSVLGKDLYQFVWLAPHPCCRRNSAIDDQRMTGHKTGSIGSKEQQRPDEFFQTSDTPHGRHGNRPLQECRHGQKVSSHFAGEPSGRERVDAHATVGPARGQIASQVDDGGLGCLVGA